MARRRRAWRRWVRWGVTVVVAAVVGVLVYSHDRLLGVQTGNAWAVVLVRGHAIVTWQERLPAVQLQGSRRLDWLHRPIVYAPEPSWWYWPSHSSNPLGVSTKEIVRVPPWLPLLGAGVMLGAAWWPRRRLEVGECAKCGYDLAGLGAGRCPECGSESGGRASALD
jgi:hypothetical protein